MFLFKMLGTAAGGGVPQWNCACQFCELSRSAPQSVPPRLQLQAIVSGDEEKWFLLNASPDLRFQIEANSELQPSAKYGRRNTPIEGIVLTTADLDQVLGVLLLREFQPLTIYATRLVRKTLEANSFFRMLERVPNQLTWIEIVPGRRFALGESGIDCTPVPLAGSLPFYARELDTGEAGQASLGLLLEKDGRRVAYTPSVPEITEELRAIYRTCDTVLVDGTFWSDAELSRTHSGTPLARSIGHVPLSGEDGTIALLADIDFSRRVFVHINNTNPILDSRSAEYRAVVDAGWQVAHDGWQVDQ
ncbi:pyrroloquinoline quinone biosynthesis protein PqqB [Edaphobacter modestus]|uniref:Coenzyme PQQ synthesis protein B n=1 Tax=Edaphobacter modestus TaxID=388466 RepID=A0A4Q7YV96_9BACT|nr:pyrroloquinoline quinone biosynthesis protein PqqB [Edaphobacter modestus]RZU40935.1 pyrroloquinoline quinone biosynthesis protein B [Edaphobacter modestus]